ncbi:hypothetical protein [Caldibacillus thermoamylovorans]|uniref:hypothetical protein n=1 Tax=Caldibacillus thermoamylovorans TaxID=35841 RepID=UPI0022DF7EED|nr:hypothetical protein [Caldibacillus thermoamylovorans]
MPTRTGLVAKKESFPAQNDDENGLRRQKRSFPAQNGDEKGFRRQKMEFLGSKWRRE